MAIVHQLFAIASKMYSGRKPVRSESYRRFVKTYPCLVCQRRWGVEACHTGPHGLRQKSSDLSCIPLCREHHRTGNAALDKIGRVRFEMRWNLCISEVIENLQYDYTILTGRLPEEQPERRAA